MFKWPTEPLRFQTLETSLVFAGISSEISHANRVRSIRFNTDEADPVAFQTGLSLAIEGFLNHFGGKPFATDFDLKGGSWSGQRGRNIGHANARV